MNEVLKTMISLSISGSLLILMLFLLKPLYKNRVSKRWQYYIWLVVIARMLLPFTPRVSLAGAFFEQPVRAVSHREIVMEKKSYAGLAENDFLPENGGFGQNGDMPMPDLISAQDTEIDLLHGLGVIWLGAALLLMVRKITAYQSFVNYMKAGRQEVSDVALLDQLAQAGICLGIKRPVELYVNSLVSSPLLFGFFRPCIVLPDAGLSEEDFRHTIWHELIHYRRRDMFYKWLVQLTVCLHWFNPLVYLMEREARRACELSCDEAVIGKMDDDGRRAYGDTLIRAMGTGNGCKSSVASITLNESVELLKERLCAIMNFKKSSGWIRLLSLLSAFLFMLGAVATGAYASPAGEGAPALKAVNDGEAAETEFSFTYPWMAGVWDIGNASPETLAEKYYQEGNLSQFAAVFGLLDEKVQEGFLEKIYADGNVVFLSVCWLDADSPLIGQFAEKAYEDGEIALFSVLTGFMDEETLKEWYARAVRDKNASFQSMLLGNMGKTQELERLEEELEAQSEAQRLEEYRNFGIIKDGTAYYYQGKMVGILLDSRWDSSFFVLNMNPEGIVNIRITRNEKDEIEKVRYMTEDERAELFGEMEDSDDEMDDGPGDGLESGVSRLNKEQLPESLLEEVMSNCAIRTWYVIHFDGQQYLYCNGFAWEYAYEPVRRDEGWDIKIVRTRRKGSGYFLLFIPDDAPVQVSCDGEEVSLVEI